MGNDLVENINRCDGNMVVVAAVEVIVVSGWVCEGRVCSGGRGGDARVNVVLYNMYI